jgi:hypothetical protein
MKNRNSIFIAIVFVFALAFALAPVTNAGPNPGGIPTSQANDRPAPVPLPPANDTMEGEQLPAITIHSTGNVLRGKTGSFVLEMKPVLAFNGMYVNFKVSGSAVAGVDYVALVTPAYIGQSGYATILVHTLADPRASSGRQAYSVVVTLEAGSGYTLGRPASAQLWIK